MTTNKHHHIPDILELAVHGVYHSPACWPAAEFRRRGYEVGFGGAHVYPDNAEFDFWIERPGTGWYQMCQEAGNAGYDGVHPAIAIELDRTWLSYDGIKARLTAEDEDEDEDEDEGDS